MGCIGKYASWGNFHPEARESRGPRGANWRGYLLYNSFRLETVNCHSFFFKSRSVLEIAVISIHSRSLKKWPIPTPHLKSQYSTWDTRRPFWLWRSSPASSLATITAMQFPFCDVFRYQDPDHMIEKHHFDIMCILYWKRALPRKRFPAVVAPEIGKAWPQAGHS